MSHTPRFPGYLDQANSPDNPHRRVLSEGAGDTTGQAPSPSLQQVFERQTPLVVQTPEAFAAQQLRTLLVKHGIDDDPDDLLLVTLVLRYVTVKPGPWKAQMGHSMSLIQAAIGNWQKRGVGSWGDHLAHPLAWREAGYDVRELGTLSKLELAYSDSYDAIYRRASPQAYAPSNQVKLDPQVFKQFVWDMQLQTHYLKSLDRFWAEHEQHYAMQCKGNLVRAVLLQRSEGSLSQLHADIVLGSLMLDRDTRWESTSYRYFAGSRVSANHSLRELRIYGYVATDILIIQRNGAADVVLYLPGNSSPLHGFANFEEMRAWITHLCRDAQKRASLASHFKAGDRVDGAFLSGVDTALRGISVYPKILDQATGIWSPRAMIDAGKRLPDPITHMAEQVKARVYADGKFEIVTRRDFYGKRLATALELMINVVGGVALVFPALVPVVAVLGAGLLAEGIGEVVAAKHKHDTEQGLQRIVFGLLNALPLVAEAASQMQATEAVMTAEERLAAKVVNKARSKELDELRDIGHPPAPDWSLQPEMTAVRPVLDTLSSDAKAQLKALKISEPMAVKGDGKGTFVYQGRLYVSLREEIYRVEWVEHEQQLCIRSAQDPRVWGPFLRAQENGYWDLDLRLKLRGGGRHVKLPKPTVTAVLRPSPTQIEGIAQQPLMEKISVTLPMDRIGKDYLGEYTARLPSGTQRVFFDADASCWRTVQEGEYVWTDLGGPKEVEGPEFDKQGVYLNKPAANQMKCGSASDFAAVRHTLPKPETVEHFTFPQLPLLPLEAPPLPREVGMIWVGERAPGAKLVERMRANVGANPDYAFTLYVDVEPGVSLDAVRDAGVTVQNLHEEAWFTTWSEHADGRTYRYFRRGSNHNYAAASDPLRFRLIEEKGGVYLDCDDQLVQPLSSKPLRATAHDVLFGEPVELSLPDGKLYFGPNNSNFASQRNNPLLRKIVDDINTRFDGLPRSFLDAPRPRFDFNNLTQADKDYIDRIFHVTGPTGMGETMRRLRPDYMLFPWGYPQIKVQAEVYSELRLAVLDHYFPLRDLVKMGAERSWQQT